MEKVKVENLSVTYLNGDKNVKAVNNISFSIEEGDSVGIIGESGSGKSTVVHAMLRLLSEKTCIVKGEIMFDDIDLLTCDEEALQNLRWKEIAIVFQKSMNSLSQIHKVGTQFEDVYKAHMRKSDRKEMKEHILKLFRKVNLNENAYNMYPFELSGGMLQRLNIALSLMFHPSLLILDEATTALDVITQGQILEELMEMERENPITRIMITHDLSVVAASCKKAIVMYAGKIVEYGTVKEITEKPLHPYTKGLIDSFPTLHGEKKRLRSIPGNMPDLSKAYKGCVFAPRCRYAMGQCFEIEPKMMNYKEGHTVYCHMCGEKNG